MPARTSRPLPLAVLLPTLLAVSVACRQPPHAGDRPAGRDAAAAPAPDAARVPSGPPARAFRIEQPADLLRGTHATGRLGDVRLDNGRAAFVVQAVGGTPFGFALGGGNLVDAAALPDGRDELAQVFLYIDRDFPRQAVYRELAIGAGAPGEAIVLARGVDSRNPQLEIETAYALAPGSRALRLTTIVRNRSSEIVAGYELGDAIQWGAADPLSGGQPECPAPDSGGLLPRLVAVGAHGSYAYLGTDELGFRCVDSAAWVDTILDAFDLEPAAPGDTGTRAATVVRWLAVGERADTSSATAAAYEARGDRIERVAALALGVDGEPVPEAQVRFTRGPATPPETLHTDAAGRGVAFLPPGDWRASAEGPGRAGAGVVEVRLPATSPVEVSLTAPGRLDVDVLTADTEGGEGERAPVRLTLHGVPPTPDPELGGPYDAGGFGNSFVLPDGRATRAVPPGTYEVLVTRGPEYDLLRQTVDVTAGATAKLRGTLVRRLETLGWLAADPHVHTAASVDSGTRTRDRVLGCAAEGVEIVVATDHNAVIDPQPDAEALGLARWIRGVPGVEITTDVSRTPVGHINLFPLAVAPGSTVGEAPIPWQDLGYAELVAGARKLSGVLVQINHPRSPFNGTFALLGIGAADDAPPQSLGMDFDLLEVANGLGFGQSFEAAADWARLARCGRRVVPTGGSDAHAMADAFCGYPRTWVFVGRDRPEGLSPETLAAAMRAGRVVVSTGPFVVLRVDDAPSGEVVVPKGRGVLVQLRVEAAPWIDVRRIRVLVNGAEALSLAPTATAPETVRLETQAPLALSGDSAIWAEVEGESAYAALPAGSPIRPWALAAPVWVDANGDGKIVIGGSACGAATSN
jgi:hypothetical protein